jgi:PhnB protein
MKFSDMPPSEDYQVAEADKDKVMYAGVPMGDMVGMFSDVPEGMPVTFGNFLSLTVSYPEKDEVTRAFDMLAEGGKVHMPLGQTFFSEWYGIVEDRFGVSWQLLVYNPEMPG